MDTISTRRPNGLFQKLQSTIQAFPADSEQAPPKDTFVSSGLANTIKDAIIAPLPGVGAVMNFENWSRAENSRDRELGGVMMGGIFGAGANLVGSFLLAGGLITQSPELLTLGAVGLMFGSVTGCLGASALRAAGA